MERMINLLRKGDTVVQIAGGNGRQIFRSRFKHEAYEKSRLEGKVDTPNNVSEPTEKLEEHLESDEDDDPEARLDKIYRQDENLETSSRTYANTALAWYNFKGNNKYELVKLGYVSPVNFGCDVIIHTNFKAKRKDDPDAPVEMFFTQLRLLGRPDYIVTSRMVVENCTNLGPIKDLPDKPYSGRCTACWGDIHHPKGLRIKRKKSSKFKQ